MISNQTVTAAKISAKAVTPAAEGILQRACACGQHTGGGGECAGCRKKRSGLQRQTIRESGPAAGPPVARAGLRPAGQARAAHAPARLAMSQSGDMYEQEASRVADRVMAGPLQDNLSGAPHQIQRLSGVPAGRMEAVPDSVDRVLASPGRPLESALRRDMEQRFDRDFSRVRVHTGALAEQSARGVNAYAYTVGQNIVFAEGRFAPGTQDGQRLLAHELTHVVQQGQAAQMIQRWAYCTPARLSLQDCPPREAGEVQNARSGPMLFLPGMNDLLSGETGALIANFDIGSAAIKPNLHETLYWNQFLKKITLNRSTWRLLGFTDCQGSEGLNQKLREERAAAVFNILPAQIKPQIAAREGAPIHDCITENNNPAERTLNRSVALLLETTTADMEPEVVQESPPEEPDTSNCSKPQRDALARAFPLAKKMVRAAFSALNDANLMRKYFGKDALAHEHHIRQNFLEIKEGLEGDPTFECEADDSMLCGGDYAYVWPVVGDNIHICATSFRKGTDFLARTIVHESAHRFAWVFSPDDICAGGCPPSMETTDAEDNADSYGEFAGDAYAKYPS